MSHLNKDICRFLVFLNGWINGLNKRRHTRLRNKTIETAWFKCVPFLWEMPDYFVNHWHIVTCVRAYEVQPSTNKQKMTCCTPEVLLSLHRISQVSQTWNFLTRETIKPWVVRRFKLDWVKSCTNIQTWKMYFNTNMHGFESYNCLNGGIGNQRVVDWVLFILLHNLYDTVPKVE